MLGAARATQRPGGSAWFLLTVHVGPLGRPSGKVKILHARKALDETYKQAMLCLQQIASFHRNAADVPKRLFATFDRGTLEDAQGAGEIAIDQPLEAPIVWKLMALNVGGEPPHVYRGISAKCQLGMCFRLADDLLRRLNVDASVENPFPLNNILLRYNLAGREYREMPGSLTDRQTVKKSRMGAWAHLTDPPPDDTRFTGRGPIAGTLRDLAAYAGWREEWW